MCLLSDTDDHKPNVIVPVRVHSCVRELTHAHVHLDTYTHTHVCTYTCTRMHVQTHTSTYSMHTCNIQTYSHTVIHANIHTPTYHHTNTNIQNLYTHTHMHVPMHARTFIHAHICAHAHTQTTKNATGLQIVKGRVRAALYSARVGSRSAFLGQGPSGGFAGGRLRRGPWEPVAVAVAEGTGRGPRAAARGAHGREKRFSRHRLDGYFFRR